MKILFLSRWFPWPTSNGSKLRIYHLLRGLAQHHEVSLLSFSDQPAVDVNSPEIRALCPQIQVVPWKPFEPQSWRAYQGFLSVTPRSVVDTFSVEMQQKIEQTLSAQRFDLLIASQGAMAAYAHYFRGTNALYEEVELAIFYEQFKQAPSLRARLRHGLTWFKQKRYLAQLVRYFRACTVASEQEQKLLAQAMGDYKNIQVVPNCVNLADYQANPRPIPQTLIYMGSFGYAPNYEAMVWFLREVYPIIRAELPEITLTITGDHAGLPLPTTEGVKLAGFVEDVRSLLAQSWVSIAPLQTGGGTRLKILEAMASRTPVVATTKGAEGIHAEPNKHLLIADTPADFAQAVIQLCQTPTLRQQLTDNAYQLIHDHYDWATTMPRFLALIEEIGQAKAT